MGSGELRDPGSSLKVSEVEVKIGVSGASGHLGRAVASELLQRPGGRDVVAITRKPESFTAGPAQGRFGDYNRPESLAEAYAGLEPRAFQVPDRQ